MSITVQELAEYYSNLLIVQYHNKEKAKATIELFINTLLPENDATENLLILDVQDAFNLETSVGDQLDILDKYVGVGREYMGALLSDDDLRFLMKLKIIQNTSNHSFEAINTSLFNFFGTDVFMVSDGNMQMTYYVLATLSTVVQAAIDKEIFPKPMGVGLRVLRTDDYFGFDEYGIGVPAERGFSDYANIDKQGATLTYNDIIA